MFTCEKYWKSPVQHSRWQPCHNSLIIEGMLLDSPQTFLLAWHLIFCLSASLFHNCPDDYWTVCDLPGSDPYAPSFLG